MAFMRLQVRLLRGDEIPCCDDCAEGDCLKCECHTEGWYGRYSAPGYMDATDYVGPFTKPEEAAREAFDLLGDDDDADSRRELAQVLWQCRARRS